MKKIISHRGNLIGTDTSNENKPKFIDAAINKGFDVEVDVWELSNGWFLGHDGPEYQIDLEFITSRSEVLWCHAKNFKSLNTMLGLGVICFWHESDKVVLTSNGFMWTFPGYELTSKSICVIPERFAASFQKTTECYGICTDFPIRFSNELNL
tara:strand:- start:164 stop:622 length:459 start_codon:yes stop_codon:yes gene_type:complete